MCVYLLIWRLVYVCMKGFLNLLSVKKILFCIYFESKITKCSGLLQKQGNTKCFK